MVCRTTINGRWDTGQIALRVDLIEREAILLLVCRFRDPRIFAAGIK